MARALPGISTTWAKSRFVPANCSAGFTVRERANLRACRTWQSIFANVYPPAQKSGPRGFCVPGYRRMARTSGCWRLRVAAPLNRYSYPRPIAAPCVFRRRPVARLIAAFAPRENRGSTGIFPSAKSSASCGSPTGSWVRGPVGSARSAMSCSWEWANRCSISTTRLPPCV